MHRNEADVKIKKKMQIGKENKLYWTMCRHRLSRYLHYVVMNFFFIQIHNSELKAILKMGKN